MTDSLISPKQPDGFSHESPIRAFTEFKVEGSVAIGKGFRPSLAHLAAYLNAMEQKEGWVFVQVLLPSDDQGDPTILFHKKMQTDIYQSFVDATDEVREKAERIIGKHPALGAPYGGREIDKAEDHPDKCGIHRGFACDCFKSKYSDPTQPIHYDGWACGDIGERLSANGYQILKYVWRLGKKDEALVEISKSITYCRREMNLLSTIGGKVFHKPITAGIKLGGIEDWFVSRIEGQPLFTQNIARMLWEGYNLRRLEAIHEALEEHRFHLADEQHLALGRGLAV